jgi:hypothetical protein
MAGWALGRLGRSRLALRSLDAHQRLVGVYVRHTGEVYMVLRFYPDGLVLYASIRAEDLLGSWAQINQWFHRRSTLSDLAQGRYLLYDGYLAFEVTSSPGTKLEFSGLYHDRELVLTLRNSAADYLAQNETYQALPVDESSLEGVFAYTSGQRNHVFRFYEDGTVIQATIFSPDLVSGWDRIRVWFNPQSPHLVVRKGRYHIQGGHVEFILGWLAQQNGSGTRYRGLILDDSLILETYSHERLSARQEYRRVEIGIED